MQFFLRLCALLVGGFIGATFAATPFSGPFIEAGYGGYKSRTEDLTLYTHTRPTGTGPGWVSQPGFLANTYAGGVRQSSVGRVALGYGLMAPGNFNFTTSLSTTTNRLTVDQWGNSLKDIWNLTLQPGYFIAPIRTLVYGSVGISRADYLQTEVHDFVPNNFAAFEGRRYPAPIGYGGGKKHNVIGLVWGAGVKLALTDQIHIAAEFTRTRYNDAKVQSSGTTAPFDGGAVSGLPAVSWQGYEGSGKITLSTWLVNFGYRF